MKLFHGGMKRKKPNHTVWNREAVSYKSVIRFFFSHASMKEKKNLFIPYNLI